MGTGCSGLRVPERLKASAQLCCWLLKAMFLFIALEMVCSRKPSLWLSCGSVSCAGGAAPSPLAPAFAYTRFCRLGRELPEMHNEFEGKAAVKEAFHLLFLFNLCPKDTEGS